MSDAIKRLRKIATDADEIAPGGWWQEDCYVYHGPYEWRIPERKHVTDTVQHKPREVHDPGWTRNDAVRAGHIAAFDPPTAQKLLDIAEAANGLLIGAALLAALEDAGPIFTSDRMALLALRSALSKLESPK